MIGQAEIQKLGELARISLSPEEATAFAAEIEAILAYVSEIQQASGELGQPSAGTVHNVLREDSDAHEPGLYTERLLNQVPRRRGEYVEVKKIIDHGG